MKLIADNQIEISYANAKALIRAYEERLAGRESAYPMLMKRTAEGTTIAVSIASDEEHYSEAELADRLSPYLPPEAWAGIR
jgi:hypothetical protein